MIQFLSKEAAQALPLQVAKPGGRAKDRKLAAVCCQYLGCNPEDFVGRLTLQQAAQGHLAIRSIRSELEHGNQTLCGPLRRADLANQTVFRIEQDCSRAVRRPKTELLDRVADSQKMRLEAVIGERAGVCIQFENWSAVGGILYLLYDQRNFVCCLIPMPFILQNRVAAAVDPLLKEGFQIHFGAFAERLREVARDHRLELKTCQVSIQSSEELPVAQFAAKHMRHR